MSAIGVLYPGAMGAALARLWRDDGHDVFTTVEGRSARTRSLAASSGATLLPGLDDVVCSSELVVSIVPPGAARGVAVSLAESVRRVGADPLILELNALAPTSVIEIATMLAPARLVDGAIAGSPPRLDAGITTMFVSGDHATLVQPLAGERLQFVDAGPTIGAASAAKMSTAAVLKGTSALLTRSLMAASHYGVAEVVAAELARVLECTTAQIAGRVALAASKSGRFADEMLEIARAQGDAGLGEHVYEALAETWTMVSRTPLAAHSPEGAASAADLKQVLAELTR